MANIPLGDFAQARAIPQAQESRLDMRALDNGRGAQALAQGLDNVGDMLMGIEQQQQQQAAAIARAEAANSALDDQVALDGLIDEQTQRLTSGEVSWADADKSFAEALAARPAPEIKGLTEPDKINFQRGLKRNQFMAQQKWQTITATHRKQYGASQVLGVFDKLQLGAQNPDADPDLLVQQAAGTRDLWTGTRNNPAEFDPKLASVRANIYDANFAARMNRTIDNPEGLLKLREDLGNEGYWGQRLGPEKANSMIGRIDNRISEMRQEEERQARKQDNLAKLVVGEVADQVELGQNPGDQRLLQATELAKDRPELALRLQEAQQMGAVVRDLLVKPATVQRAWVSQQRADLDANGGTKDQYARLDRIDAILKRRADARKTNPFGDPVLAAAATPLQFDKPEEMGIELRARLAASDATREKNPDFGDALLRTEEAAALTEAIKRTPAAQLPKVLASYYQEFGDKVYPRVMKQIGVTDSVVAAAGIRLANDLKAERSPMVAVGIIQGRALLTAKDKTIAMPKDADLAAAFAATYGTDKPMNGAYAGRPDDYRADIQAAKAYYATLTAEAGDISGEFDEERWTTAVEATVGKAVEIEGFRMLPPPGMDADTFEEKASSAIDEAVRTFGLNGGIFGNDFTLRNVPGRPGFYYLINVDEGGKIVRDANNKTIGIDLND